MLRGRVARIAVTGLLVVCTLLFINGRSLRVLSSSQVIYKDVINENVITGVLKHPTGVAVVPELTGPPSVFISDTRGNVLRWYKGGALVRTLGTGQPGYVNGSTNVANPTVQFNGPSGLSAGKVNWTIQVPPPGRQGSYYWVQVNEAGNHVVRLICLGQNQQNTCESVTTEAGSGVSGYSDGAALQAKFSRMSAIPSQVVGASMIADSDNHVIRQLSSGNVTTFAGNNIQGLRNGFRTSAEFNHPTKTTPDSAGNTFVADAGNRVIRKIDTSGNVSTFSGSGLVGSADGTASVAKFSSPTSIAYLNGVFYVADALNNKIRKIDASGNVTTYAGTGKGGLINGTLAQATFSSPSDLAIFNNIMYVADTNNNAIRAIDMTTGQVSTYAH